MLTSPEINFSNSILLDVLSGEIEGGEHVVLFWIGASLLVFFLRYINTPVDMIKMIATKMTMPVISANDEDVSET